MTFAVQILPDYHGVEEPVGKQIEYLEILAEKIYPETVYVFHEPIPSNLTPHAEDFSRGALVMNDFLAKLALLALGTNWGPSDPYEDLYIVCCILVTN